MKSPGFYNSVAFAKKNIAAIGNEKELAYKASNAAIKEIKK